MSGTFPVGGSNPSFNAVNFKINTPTLTSKTLSGKTRRVGMGHSYYSFSVKYPSLTRYEMGPIVGFLSQQFGQLESFQITLPEISYSKIGTQVPTVTVSGGTDDLGSGIHGYAAGKTQIGVTSLSGNILRAGDVFKFNHATDSTQFTKVYMCAVSCITPSGSTTNTLYFSGGLVDPIPNGTTLTINAVPFTVILENNLQQFDTGIGGITSLSLDMIEVW